MVQWTSTKIKAEVRIAIVNWSLIYGIHICALRKFAAPNYFPNSFGGPTEDERVRKLQPPSKASGDVHRYQVRWPG